MAQENNNQMLYREYGSGGIQLSAVGFGGMIVAGADQAVADKHVAEAIESGVNYFDVAPTYGDAQLKLGHALAAYRKDCFLACKTTERTREGAARELEESLKQLRTDYFDLYQLHALNDVAKDVDVAFGKGGAMEAVLEAKRAGVIRHVGFSAHTEEAALAAMDRYAFDSVLFPINFVCYFNSGFGERLLKRANEKNVTVLALKALAKERWQAGDPNRDKWPNCWYQPVIDPELSAAAVRFTLSRTGVTATVPGGDIRLFHAILAAVKAWRTMDSNDEQLLRQAAKGLAAIFPEVQ